MPNFSALSSALCIPPAIDKCEPNMARDVTRRQHRRQNPRGRQPLASSLPDTEPRKHQPQHLIRRHHPYDLPEPVQRPAVAAPGPAFDANPPPPPPPREPSARPTPNVSVPTPVRALTPLAPLLPFAFCLLPAPPGSPSGQTARSTARPTSTVSRPS